ncbi:MAG TPA: lytic transglycosylase domain-containing protein, partial [Pseudolabrys sp.]|nr:lytic transglycosylase domain-containing protein [Pseudolabrys sp.]
LLFQESKFKPGIVSHAGAQGIAQFMPKTAAEVGLDNPFDPLQAIPAAARLLRGLVDQFSNLGLAAAAYNAGPTRVHDWLKRKSHLPAETRGYVKTITGKPAESWKNALPAYGETNLPEKAPCKAVAPRHHMVITASVPLPPQPPARAAAARIAQAAKASTKVATSRARKAVISTVARAHVHRKIAIELAARRRRLKRQRD